MTASGKCIFFGWHGFGLEHPAEWELNRIRGGRKSSYLVFDDGTSVRLEMSWKPIDRKLELKDIVDSQVKSLEKAAKRRKRKISIRRRQRIGRPKGFEYECFTWDADVSACELVARCKECGRVVLLRVMGEAGSLPKNESRLIFTTLECYSGEDHERWGSFGLDVLIPAEFELESSSLKAGACQLMFSDKKTELKVGRVSMARAILEKKKLVEWYENFDQLVFRPFKVEWTNEEFRGHVGYKAEGVLKAGQRLRALFRNPRRLSARCFYCEESDKILTVSADGPGKTDELVDEVRGGLICHG